MLYYNFTLNMNDGQLFLMKCCHKRFRILDLILADEHNRFSFQTCNFCHAYGAKKFKVTVTMCYLLEIHQPYLHCLVKAGILCNVLYVRYDSGKGGQGCFAS